MTSDAPSPPPDSRPGQTPPPPPPAPPLRSPPPPGTCWRPLLWALICGGCGLLSIGRLLPGALLAAGVLGAELTVIWAIRAPRRGNVTAAMVTAAVVLAAWVCEMILVPRLPPRGKPAPRWVMFVLAAAAWAAGIVAVILLADRIAQMLVPPA